LSLIVEIQKLTFDRHLIVAGVPNAKLKQSPHTNSEACEVSDNFGRHFTFSEVHRYLLFPFVGSKTIDAVVNFFIEGVIVDFVVVQV
jgi:hypothetical protein